MTFTRRPRALHVAMNMQMGLVNGGPCLPSANGARTAPRAE